MARIYKSFSTTSPLATANGNLYDIEVVVENIRNLFKTRKGEYPMIPDLGSIAHEYIHEPSLSENDKRIIIDDTMTLLEYEPRLNNVMVDIEEIGEGFYIIINAVVLPQNQEVNLTINLED